MKFPSCRFSPLNIHRFIFTIIKLFKLRMTSHPNMYKEKRYGYDCGCRCDMQDCPHSHRQCIALRIHKTSSLLPYYFVKINASNAATCWKIEKWNDGKEDEWNVHIAYLCITFDFLGVFKHHTPYSAWHVALCVCPHIFAYTVMFSV